MKIDLYLIIGLTKESRHWSNDFIDEMKSKLDLNSIQLVDLPGSGKFLQQKSPASMKEIVNEARSQLKFNPENQRVVIAVSLGGMLAWSWICQYQDDFTHLVMINSSLGSLSPFWKRLQPKALLKFLQIAMAKKGTAKERHILELCSNHPQNAKRVYPSWVKIGEEANMSLMNTIRQMVAGMQFKPESIPKVPMLVIAAKHDRLAHFSCSQAIAAHASAKLVLSEDPAIGHAFHVDGPILLAETIQQWITELS